MTPEQVAPITDEEYNTIMKNCIPHIEKLQQITLRCGEIPEGNVYYLHNSYQTSPDKIPVQKKLDDSCKAFKYYFRNWF